MLLSLSYYSTAFFSFLIFNFFILWIRSGWTYHRILEEVLVVKASIELAILHRIRRHWLRILTWMHLKFDGRLL